MLGSQLIVVTFKVLCAHVAQSSLFKCSRGVVIAICFKQDSIAETFMMSYICISARLCQLQISTSTSINHWIGTRVLQRGLKSHFLENVCGLLPWQSLFPNGSLLHRQLLFFSTITHYFIVKDLFQRPHLSGFFCRNLP